MIDNLNITLSGFTGDFRNCRFIKSDKIYNYYYLYRTLNDSNSPKLIVKQNFLTGKVVISNSLRKWYYGQNSLLDLDYKSFDSVLFKIAKFLNIKIDELYKAKITKCEIGQNLRLSIPVSNLIPKLVDFGHLKRSNFGNETVYFINSYFKVIIYDKLAELGAKTKSDLKKEAFNKLNEKGHHFVRIEFKLMNKNSFNQYEFENSIEFLHCNFKKLYEFWTLQINRIVIFTEIEMNLEKMKSKEYLIGLGLNTIGFSNLLSDYQQLCRSKSDRGLKTQKSKVYTQILDVISKYSAKGDYVKNSLRIDVSKHLLRKSKNEDLDLKILFKSLWGISN